MAESGVYKRAGWGLKLSLAWDVVLGWRAESFWGPSLPVRPVGAWCRVGSVGFVRSERTQKTESSF